MKNILIQFTIFLSISSFAQYQYNEYGKVSSQFSQGNSFLFVVNVPGGGGGNGPYREVRDKLIRQIEERKEEIKEKVKLLAEKMGYDSDSVEISIAIPAYEKADPLLAYPYYWYWSGEIPVQKEIRLLGETEDAFLKVKPFYDERYAQFSEGKLYIIHPGGGGGNGPYKGIARQWGQEEHFTGQKMRIARQWGQEEYFTGRQIRGSGNTIKLVPFSISDEEIIIRKWTETGLLEGDITAMEEGEIDLGEKVLQMIEEQMETIERYDDIANAFLVNPDWNYYEEGKADAAMPFVIKESPDITAFGSSLSTGHIDFGVGLKIKTHDFGSSSYEIDPSLEKGIYAAEPIGGGGGLGGSFHIIQIK